MYTATKQFRRSGSERTVRRPIARGLSVLAVFVFVITGVFFYTRGGASAAASSTLNFQARLLSNTGSVVADGSYNIRFNLYTVASGGTTQWTETYAVSAAQGVTVKNGYFSVNLGSITAFPNTIAWDQEQWLGMTVQGTTNCTFDVNCAPLDAEMTPRFKLTAVPYAFRAGALMNDAGTSAFTADDLVQLAPSNVQAINLALSAIRLNQTGVGGLLQLQGNGSDVFTVGNNGNTISAGNISANGGTLTAGTNTQTGSLVLNDGSLNTTTVQAGATSSNLTFVLPTSYGNNGECLTTNGSGVLSFAATCGGTLSVNPTANVRKTVDETQNNVVNPTAALQNDDELFFGIGANETWSFRFVVTANANATPDIRFAVTAPTGATCRIGANDQENAVAVGNLGCGVSTGLFAAVTAEDTYEIFGTVVNGATAGNITLQWSQNTANAAATIVRAGSFVNANRIAGPAQTAQAFIQGANSFGTLATFGTNDNNALSITTNGIERLRVLATGETRFASSVIANNTATGTTATTSGTGTNTTTVTFTAANGFVNNDVIFIDNAGQDFYTRIVSGGGTATVTVSPAVSFENARTVTRYNVQNIGATATDYTTRANRFFQGYFLGGVTVGAGSTTISDGIISRTSGDIILTPGTGGIIQVDGTLNATTITGDGSAITNISASNISGGTISDSSLSANVVLLNAGQTFSALQTFGNGITVNAGQTLTVNGDGITDFTGTGLTLNGGVLEVTLGTSIDLTSEVTGVLPIANGGTGAGTQQAAINALSGLTTEGDLLYYDGTNTTRLARGSNGQCLTSTATGLAWASCTTGAVTSVGVLDSQTKSANGAVVSSGALVLQTADASNPGIVSTGAQTLSGDKTFSGLITGNGGLTLVGSTLVNTTGSSTTSIGNSTGALTLTGSSGSTIVLGGTTIDAAELNRLNGVNAALIDIDDSVTTAITGTGTLTTGAIGIGFGNINIGTNTFTGNGSGLTNLSGSNITTGTIANAQLTGSGALTITAGNGLSGGGSVALGASTSLSVVYGATANTSVQGNTTLTCTGGTGNLTGGGNTITLGSGGTCGAISIVNNPTFSGLITGQTGLEITGGAVNLNNSSNNATNINTGTSTGTVTIGGGASTLVIDSVAFDVSSTGAVSGVSTLVTSSTITVGGLGAADTSTILCRNSSNSIAACSQLTDAQIADTLTASSFVGSGSTSGAVDLATAEVAGTLTIARGGTGVSATPTNGQLLIGNGSGYTLGTIANNGGVTITNGAGTIGLAVAYGSSANTAVQGNVSLICAGGTGNLTGGGNTITLGSGGTCGAISTNNAVSFTTSVTTPILTSAGALNISSGGTSALSLNSASNILVIDSTDTTLQRSGAGSFTLDLSDAGTTSLVLSNTGTGVASLDLSDGNLLTGGTARLTNAGALQNITGLTITSGGASITGASSFADATNLNGNVVIGDAATDRLVLTSQINGASALVFQGATDNAFATTLSITDPTANNTVTLPNASGTVLLLGASAIQADSSTNASIAINKTGASGNILTLQRSGVGVFTVANDGSTLIQLNSTVAFNVRNATGTDQFLIDSTNSLVRIGSATADATATVLVTDAKNTTGDPNGLASTDGAMYYSSFWQQYRCYRDGRWETCGVNPIERGFVFNEEFISGYTGAGCTTATAIIGDQNWTCFTSGAANTSYNIGAILPTADRPGIIRMTTAAANGNGFTMALAGNNSGSVIVAPQNRVKAAAGMGATITNNRLRIGLHNQTTTNVRSNSGVYWEADPTTNANWQYCYGTGVAAVCTSSGVAIAASTLYSLDIFVAATGTGTSSVTFTINGTSFTVSNITIDTTNRVNPAISCYNSIAAARECFVDYYQFSGVASTRR